MIKRIVRTAFLGACSCLGGAAVVAWGPRLGSNPVQGQGPAEISFSRSDLGRLADRFETVAHRVSPAAVYVEAVKPPTTPNATGSKGKPVEESGSGVIIRLDGRPGYLVLTNNHVIANAAADQITINLADGRLLRPGRVWADPESDVALLRLDVREDLPTAPLGNSDAARVGQWVLAVGSPFGLNQTVTHGIVSAKDRGQISLGSTIRIKDFLQTDAAINPGSSGGPLVNMDGEVIGINTAIASHNGSNSGVAFSIPINLVKRVAQQLLDHGAVVRGYLGMQLSQGFEPADARKVGLDRVQGAFVETVYPETPAALAGLQTNDVVLRVDDVTIRNENHLINMISGLVAGQRVRLEVWRERRTVSLNAVVGDWNKAQTRFRPGP